MDTMAFDKLFAPGKIGTMALNNRLVMPPMGTNYATEDGYVTQRLVDYYEARARGGIGLVIVEIACIDFPRGQGAHYQIGIDDDRFLPGLTQLAAAIRHHGARAAIQLHHAGRLAKKERTGYEPVAPSPLAAPGGDLPRELTKAEIADIVARFVQAANRACRAGFDGVEVHSAHGFLLTQFLSPASNKRQDEYGGSLEKRARILVEVLAAIRAKLGRSYPVWCRLDGREQGIEGGITPDMARQTALLAEKAGADAASVSAYGFGANSVATVPASGADLHQMAALVKTAIRIPVIAVGHIDPATGEKLLADGKADFIAMGRKLLTDPDFPRKAAEGKLADAMPCIGCLHCMNSELIVGEPIRCSVNAALGREAECKIEPAAQRKKVLVIGGGPGGMEAARVAALRGHQVTLYEKQDRLGGQLNLAVLPPHKKEIAPYIEYLEGQLRKLGVTVKLGLEVAPDLVQSARPDAVVVATGVTPLAPAIPGLKGAVTAEQVLLGQAEVGGKVVIIGGELVGCETAEFLADKGKHVTVTRRGPRLATKMPLGVRLNLLNRLRAKGVTLLGGVQYEGVENGSLVVSKDGQKQAIEADTFVLAAGSRPNDSLLTQLRDRGFTAYAVGDCAAPRNIMEAVAEGFRAGLET